MALCETCDEEDRPSRRRLLLGVGISAATLAIPGAARAQEPPVDPADEPLPRPVVVYPLQDARVTVFVDGEYGPLRISGTLAETPKEVLRLADPGGRTREVGWNEIRSLQVNTFAAEGFPEGSYRLSLLSDPLDPSAGGAGGGSGYSALTSGTGGATWKLQRLPAGALRLKGKPYGEITIPLGSISSLSLEPVRGSTTEIPAGAIKVEILPSVVVSVPLTDVRNFRRDLTRGTVSVTLEDDQLYAGKLVELPNVSLAVRTAMGPVAVPLSGIAQFDRAVPGARRL